MIGKISNLARDLAIIAEHTQACFRLDRISLDLLKDKTIIARVETVAKDSEGYQLAKVCQYSKIDKIIGASNELDQDDYSDLLF